jgi:hypothetical protein
MLECFGHHGLLPHDRVIQSVFGHEREAFLSEVSSLLLIRQ